MSQAVLFALDALHDHLDELTASIDAAHFSDRRVQLRHLARQEGTIRSCIALLEQLPSLLEQLPIAQDHLPANDGEGLHRRPLPEAG